MYMYIFNARLWMKIYYVLCLMSSYESKLYNEPKSKPKRTPPANICSIFFCNEGIELINLPRILRDPNLQNDLPTIHNKFEPPMVAFKLSESIGSEVFNFNKFVESLDVDAFISDETILPCNCACSPFIDNDHGHIMTGDLRIVADNNLRKLLCKGPKYREQVKIDWNDARYHINVGLDKFIDKSGVEKYVAKRRNVRLVK